MNIGRKTELFENSVFTKDDKISIGDHSRVDAFVKIEGGNGVRIGDYVHIASFCHLNIGGGELVMEDGTACGSGTRIISGGNQPQALSCSRSAPDDQQIVGAGKVIMRKNSCCYAGVTICGHADQVIEIGEGARIAAGAVLTKSVGAGELWKGVPARCVGVYIDGKFYAEGTGEFINRQYYVGPGARR